MTKQFRKTSRLAVDALFVALNDNYTEEKRDDARAKAETLTDQAEIERESAGDKAAHAALKRLQILVRHSRFEEVGYKRLDFAEVDWQDAERQAKDCASALDEMMGTGKYTPVVSCAKLPKMFQPACGDRVPDDLRRDGRLVGRSGHC